MFTMPDMAKREGPTKPVTLRLNPELVQRLREFGKRHEFRITMTDMLNTAVREFLERREQQPKSGKR
jgi:uncharacterized protein (DUF4415 family)